MLSPSPIEMASGTGGAASVLLVVDDDPLVRSLTVRVLQRAAFATVEADSGPAALAALGEARVDAVLLDQLMPGMTGIELTRAIRALPGHAMTPVLFLSAVPDPEVRIAALQAGATDFMVKPVVLNELVARVEAQLKVTSAWRAAVSGLQQRSVTVAELAQVGSELNPTVAARAICERISRAYAGAAVGIYACAEEACTLLAYVGSPPRIPEGMPGGEAAAAERAEAGPWIHHDPAGAASHPSWWACAPLRRGAAVLGILAIEGRTAAGAGAATSSGDQLLAAAVDYAATAALHLAAALSGSQRLRRRRNLLERMLSEGTFSMVFQPVVDLRDDHIIGYEALARFGDGEAVSQRLIDAEEAGIRPRIELALLAAALSHTGRLRPGTWMSVNLSPSVLVLHAEEVGRLLRAAAAPTVVELTENERIVDYAAVRAALDHLGPGVELSIDDAGAGYASLRHVADLRPQYLKLDRSWISGLPTDGPRQALVAGLAAFCEHTGTDLIAEGIETPEERSALEALGVRYAQGFLLGRPAPLPAAAGALRPG